jgi:hypothetical protein
MGFSSSGTSQYYYYPPAAPGAIGREWSNAETQYILDMICEYFLNLEK